MNIAAILTANEIERNDGPVTREHQKRLVRFTGFGASDLANGIFRRPGEADFRDGWEDLGSSLESAVSEADYASLARCTQYAHFTPEFIIRAIWAGLQRLGWRGGRVLEPGIGTGLFPALMPAEYRDSAYVTGVELDPVTARIARLLQPRARIINSDFTRTDLAVTYDLAVGNPDYVEVLHEDDQRHPPTEQAMLETYAEWTARARAFLAESGLVTLPPGESCDVVPSPVFRRPILGVASYIAPPAFSDPIGRRGSAAGSSRDR